MKAAERPPGSFAFWPPAQPRPRERILATTGRAGELLIGAEVIVVDSWHSFKEALEERNLEVFAPPLPGWRWWQEAAADPAAFVVLGKEASPRAIVVQGRRRRHWIVDAAVWHRKPDAALLRDLRRVAEATGVGIWGTPARTGDAMQRHDWRAECGRRLESRPNDRGRTMLLEGGVGGRGQTFLPGLVTPAAWEIDQRDAYAAAWARPKPTGRAMVTHDATRLRGGEVTAFGPVRWRISRRLECPGPLAVRKADGNLAWPTEPGTYQGYAWHEECQDARSCLVEVEPAGPGVAWSAWVQSDLWTRRMSEARRQAGGWGSLLKLCTVAAIGRHGRKPEGWTAVEEPQQGDVGFSPEGQQYGRRAVDLPSMSHWYGYALMLARRTVWHRAVAEQWGGRRIVALETDSVILDGPPLGPVVHRGDDLPGEWSVRHAGEDCYTPLTRWAIWGDGSGRTPGLPRAYRAAWLLEHPPPGPSG